MPIITNELSLVRAREQGKLGLFNIRKELRSLFRHTDFVLLLETKQLPPLLLAVVDPLATHAFRVPFLPAVAIRVVKLFVVLLKVPLLLINIKLNRGHIHCGVTRCQPPVDSC